ncbi:type I restriction endonuclease subunit R [Glutamicibacter sp. ZJUTW]|uniref:type I restriction endonuclease subunit R n=1 Tax=Glutamicibacter sp. ZJUTW TaxID=1155384 RepID=UPI0011F102D9|nr:type I restriction endonuclease subunit R [Glutamicibacter sp. ZJUTW]QEP06366.1 type I restriction endonuclease subunit R [Glutamicibacter sp. ZJUTW]
MIEAQARKYDTIAVGNESTVVAEFVPDSAKESSYQSEAQLEREFIRLLEGQAYEYVELTSEEHLVANLRAQLEALNRFTFSDTEWQRFFKERVASTGDGIVEKTVRIQEDHVQLLTRDDGTTKNITLLDKQNIHNNRLQVINQYAVDRGEGGASFSNRYDVTVLVNGLPLVHIELKRRGVPIREAFNQIDRYQRDSFWAGSGLFEYVQLFVISNGTQTKYYSNTTRRQHVLDMHGSRRTKKTSNSFEFTSWWADAQNKPILDLTAFAKTFFAKHTLLNIITRYCVLTNDRLLLVMRPYQIVATEKILQKIEISTNYKTLGTLDAGGYVWHTTGSGKTLTSFKAAQLASRLTSVDKVLFVVDRKDLDYQTMKEYDRFEKGSANSNTSTAVLKRQLEDPSKKIIITTIQKLSTFIAGNKGHEIYSGHIVLIFDECHRSQFGDMHTAITKAFKRYNLFGFTGTPIFAANSGNGGNPQLKTTAQAFGDKLHTYTIVDAITDKNVLPFRIDYVNTIKVGQVAEKQVSSIDTESALLSPVRVSQVTKYILEHFDQKTKRSEGYALGDKRVRGFNSIFATASIAAARTYYQEFKHQQEGLLPDQKLKIATIFSYAANPDAEEGVLDEEGFDTQSLSGDARSFLESAIRDYNAMFGTSFDTSSDSFQNYYKDLSLRLKNRDLDMVIVVNMFLTGFDATTLNTLWVDKNLRSHGLIQAYSRTNRILNSVKTYGNIVSFRNLEEETNDAIALFGNKEATGVVLLKPYGEYYQEYAEKVTELMEQYQPGQWVVGEANQNAFVKLFGDILRLRNILTSFDEFEKNEILSPRDVQDYQSTYLDIWNDRKPGKDSEKEQIVSDLVFEIELIKQVEINVDYILMLVQKYREERGNGQDQEIRAGISRAIDSSPTLRNKKDLIENFVDTVSLEGSLEDEWTAYLEAQREKELGEIIAAENLKPEETVQFIDAAFREGSIRASGTAITKVLPPVSRFSKEKNHGEKKRRVVQKLGEFFERFFGLVTKR